MASSVGSTTVGLDQGALAVSRETEATERQCWVCFVTDKEAPSATWVQPCRCRGSTRWVHTSCLLRWIDERQKGQLDATVCCSQCQTSYQIRLPPSDRVEAALQKVKDAFNNTSPLVSLSGLLGGCIFCLFKFGEATVYIVVGSAEAQRIVDETDPIVTFCGFTLLPVAFLGMSMVNWEEKAVSGFKWLWPQACTAFHSVWPKSKTSPTHTDPIDWQAVHDEDTSAEATDVAAVNDDRQTNNAHFEATIDGLSLSRTLMGAVSLPFIATLCGQFLVPRAIKGNVKRAVFGGLTFLLVKSCARMYVDFRHQARLKHRVVLNQFD